MDERDDGGDFGGELGGAFVDLVPGAPGLAGVFVAGAAVEISGFAVVGVDEGFFGGELGVELDQAGEVAEVVNLDEGEIGEEGF